MPWVADVDAISLLDAAPSGPFTSATFRRCFVEFYPEWTDASFGARLVDGTLAALPALSNGRLADSMPFNHGGVAASRALGEVELRSFLELARRVAGVVQLQVRWCPVHPEPREQHIGARVAGWTSVVHIHQGEPIERRLDPKARRALRVADRAGATVTAVPSVDDFVQLYERSSIGHWLRYPAPFLRSLSDAGVVRTFTVRVGLEPVSSVLVLMTAGTWVTWLAASSPEGREVQGNYLATAAVLRSASEAGVAAVELGPSAGMPGVAMFKARFDSVDLPILQYEVSARGHAAVRATRRLRGTAAWRVHSVRRRFSPGR